MVRLASPNFVGRSAELAALDEALDRAETGQTTTVLVGGDAGVGKSRLLSTWSDRARSRGATVISGVCLDVGESGPAYAAVIQALRELLLPLSSTTVEELVGSDPSPIARILPELSSPTVTIDEPGGLTPMAQTIVFQRLAGVLDRAAIHTPLVLGLEDLHWADPSTRAFLLYLVNAIRQAKLLILGTFRTDETVRDHPLRATIRQLERTAAVSRIDLPSFDVDEVRQQLDGILGTSPSRTLLEAIFARSEGNALFAEELVAVGDPDVDLPHSVGEALIARSSSLTEDTRSVLRLASVVGRTSPFGVLQRASSRNEDQLADALREAVAANILEADHPGERYRFRHALLQEAIYLDAMPGERRRLHAAVADALEHGIREPLSDAELVPQLARHWFEAGDPDRAVMASAAAGDLAVRQSAHAEAVHHYRRVDELWDEAPIGRQHLSRPAILERAARSAFHAGEPNLSMELGERALADVDETVDPVLMINVLEGLRLAAGHVGTGEAFVRYERRLAAIELDDLPALERMKILDCRVMTLRREGDYAAANKILSELVELAERERDTRPLTMAHLARGWILREIEDVDGAIREARLARDLASSDGSVESELEALGLIYESYWFGRRYEDTITAARAMRAFGNEVGLSRSEVPWASLGEAASLFALGRLDESMDVIDEALRDPPADRALPLLLFEAAHVATARGSFADAAQLLADAAAAAAASDDEIAIAYAPLARVRLANAERRFDEVREIVMAAAPRLVETAPHYEVSETVWSMVEVGLDAEATRVEAAEAAGERRVRDEAKGIAQTMSGYVYAVRRRRSEAGIPDTGRHRGVEALIEGHIARIEGRDDPALWDVAAVAFPPGSIEALSARYRQAEAMLAGRAGQAGRAGRDELATIVSPAHGRAVEVGARPLATKFESVARRGRVDLRPKPEQRLTVEPDTPTDAEAVETIEPGQAALRARGLSDREIEVLTLVAAGYSNGDIARRLFISSKTASVHVSHILDKLGVSTRVEAATIGVRLGLPEVDAD